MKIEELGEILKNKRAQKISFAEMQKIFPQSERSLLTIEGTHGPKGYMLAYLFPYLRALSTLMVLTYNNQDFVIQSQADFWFLINKIIIETGTLKQRIIEALGITWATLKVLSSSSKSSNITLFLGLCDFFAISIAFKDNKDIPEIDNSIAAQITINNITVNGCNVLLAIKKQSYVFRTDADFLTIVSKYISKTQFGIYEQEIKNTGLLTTRKMFEMAKESGGIIELTYN